MPTNKEIIEIVQSLGSMEYAELQSLDVIFEMNALGDMRVSASYFNPAETAGEPEKHEGTFLVSPDFASSLQPSEDLKVDDNTCQMPAFTFPLNDLAKAKQRIAEYLLLIGNAMIQGMNDQDSVFDGNRLINYGTAWRDGDIKGYHIGEAERLELVSTLHNYRNTVPSPATGEFARIDRMLKMLADKGQGAE